LKGLLIRDLTERVKAEEALKKTYNELEHLVKECTLERNNALKTIKRSEKELTQRKFALEKLNRELIETNQALSILARNIDRDKELLEKKIYEIINTNIIPIIKELLDDKSCQKRLADLELLKTYLNGLIPGQTDQHEIVACLSSQEMRVAAMIKRGLTSPKIAGMLNVSLHTVKTHRKNIRKKLKLQNSNVNLCSYLRSKMVSDSM
jgi:DNA-binding CsgD family transcriptional regulator